MLRGEVPRRRWPGSRRGRRAARSRPRSAGRRSGRTPPHQRLLDEVDHVRERRPARPPGRVGQLHADLPPRRDPIPAVANRIAGAQQRGDRLAHGVVDDEALAAQLDEGQRPQPLERRGRRLARQNAGEQRQRHAAQHAGRVERLARAGVEPVEVERGELLHDRRQHRVLGRVRPLADGRRRELERERVAADEAVDPRGLRRAGRPRGAPRPRRPAKTARAAPCRPARRTTTATPPLARRAWRARRAFSGSEGRAPGAASRRAGAAAPPCRR